MNLRKKGLFLLAAFLLTSSILVNAQNKGTFIPGKVAQSQTVAQGAGPSGEFDKYFVQKTLRIDYFLAGDSKTEIAYFRDMRQEPFWGGPHDNTIDPFNYGTYRYSAYDSASKKLIYSRGFSSLFQEWKGTDEAKKMKRAFPMTAVLPFPKNTIRFVIEKRSYATNAFEVIFDRYINPSDYFINRENIHPLKVTKIRETGDPATHVDIAFIAEGYTAGDMEKFRNDASRLSDYILSVEPYSKYTDKFNFYAIEAPSDEAGVTIPGKDIFVNTSIHSSFYTFDMDRYMTTFDTKSIYDAAANVPYDAVIVLVNSKRYGGGGFYNHYCESTVDNQYSTLVLIHEFGHSFAGLADEYYASEVTYSDFYNLKFEPWEPNITTKVNFNAKWKKMISPETPIPTPKDAKYNKTVGAFEGGGYLSKGIFSPTMDCRMKSNEAPGFCPVCQDAISKMILFYCD
ncbi:MAG: IgA Peptidase M64 [Bacteroidales bacterium]|nr:IgA Peptidase M64 [Bacteroidales bacterium]